MTGPLFPENYSKIWIRGRFITMAGVAVRGKLTLAPTVTNGGLVNRSLKLIMSSAAFSADTDNDGYVAVQVPATNDPDITPINFTYAVTTPIGQKFSIVVPYDTTPLNSVGDPLHGQPVIELIDVVPVGSSGGVGQLLRGIGIQSMVDNGAGGLLITYTDLSTTTIAMPDTVQGPVGPTGPVGPAGPVGPIGGVVVDGDPVAGLEIDTTPVGLADLHDVNVTGAAVGGALAVADLTDPAHPTFKIGTIPAPRLTDTTAKTAAYTAADRDLVPVNTIGGPVTVTLPAATEGRTVAVRWQYGGNPVTIVRAGTDVIGSASATNYVLPAVGGTVVLQAVTGGGRWRAISDFQPSKPTEISAPRMRLVNPAGLSKWHAALANRRTAPVRVVVSGNSNWEGTGATNYADRLPLALQARLRRVAQPSGVAGASVPNLHLAGMSPVPANPPYTIGGSAAGSQYGLGGRGFKLVAGTTLTIPFTGDRVRIFYVRAVASGIANIVLDGGAAVTVDGFNSGAETYGMWDSGPLTAGSHTLVVTRDASTTAGRDVLMGDVEVFNGDYASGVRVYDHARHGVTAQGFYTATLGWRHEFAALNPWHLMVCGFGENDTARTPEQYKADVQGFLSYHRVTGGFTGSTLLVHGPKPSDIAQSIWDSFALVEKEIALTDPDVAWFDLSQDIPGVSDATGLGIYFDTKHKSTSGQAWAADQLAWALSAEMISDPRLAA